MNGKNDFNDDQRVVAPMNIEGAPWFVRSRDESKKDTGIFMGEMEDLKGKDLFRLMSYAVFAGLSVAMVFIVAYFLFIMFALNVWFK
ncbi:hypothetical protein [Gudongella sp. SC589]|jgi:hypothetical protein|uniref:hypothetical protein n=1 Tax=Gudongella sp. SC589 TaxID=3385990 RepID=UPI003904B641